MLVQWKEPRALTLHRPDGAKATPHSILVPGYNELDDDIWASYEKQPAVKNLMDARKLRVKKPSKDNKKSNKGLLNFDLHEAEEIIKETYSKPVLQSWKDIETRQAVVNELDKQMKFIKDSVLMRTEDDEAGPRYQGTQG